MRRTLLTLAALAVSACKGEAPPAAREAHSASPLQAQDAAVPALQRPAPRDGGVAEARAPATPPTLPPEPTAAGPDAGSADAAWTAGVVEQKRTGEGSVQLAVVRAARQQGFDRVVFEFAGSALPGYHLEYVDTPIIRCGSGEPTQVAGQGWLQVRLTGARAHTEAGQPTVAPRERKLQLGVLRELEQTCDFEGEVTWVLGLQHPHRFRVLELKSPTRLVVDVQQ